MMITMIVNSIMMMEIINMFRMLVYMLIIGFCTLLVVKCTEANAQVLPLPTVQIKDYYGASPETRIRQHQSLSDFDSMDIYKAEKDSRLEATLDRLLFNDFMKELRPSKSCGDSK